MMKVGIEKINFYGGPTVMDVKDIFVERGLDTKRFDNLLMEKKSVGLPCEDAVTNGVNAALPIIKLMSEEEKSSIELLIVASESGIDFGKSIGTYIHDYLKLNKNCCLFEVKQACFGGTAGLHMAINYVVSNVSPSAKALVIATDVARAAAKGTYGEPTQAVGAVAMLVSDQPDIMQVDIGAYGDYSYEVMDTCRPLPEIEIGNSDLSLLSYLDCLTNAYDNYKERVDDVCIDQTFEYLVFHTPFGGMVKGAHRTILNHELKLNKTELTTDFERRVLPALRYCMQVGNVYSASTYLSLCSLIDHVTVDKTTRIGLFSYGSGCSSKFYSGTIRPDSAKELCKMTIKEKLDRRYALSFSEYEKIVALDEEWIFGLRDKEVDFSSFLPMYQHFFEGREYLVLEKIDDFHRKYRWS